MNRTLFLLLLVVLESRGKLILDAPYSGTSSKLNEERTPFNFTKDESIVEGPEPISRQEDPESSETVFHNKVQRSLEDEDDEESEEDPEGPPDHVIPYSDHEEPGNVSTKPKYVGPGEWAKPPKNSDVPLDFVPTKLYAQVRKTHTVRRLPRRKALEYAESEEEKENAARLREVVRNSKVNTVYTEEGYEDSAYDHGGHVRDADFEEEYARKVQERLKDRKKVGDDAEQSKTDPEDYEDYEDHKIASNIVNERNEKVYPKVVVEEGIEQLQDDLEREAEETEKRFEIGKLDEDGDSKENGGKKVRKRKRPSKKSKIDGESVEATTIPIEATTLNFAPYKYETHENSPVVNVQKAEENPTTVSYSQIFWDYFKKKQSEPTSQSSTSIDSTTVNPNYLQASTLGNTLAPYSFYGEEATTLFPAIDSSVFDAKNPEFLVDPEFKNDQNQLSRSKNTDISELWQPISNEPTTTDAQYLGTYDEIMNDQGIPFSNFVRNLDSKESNMDGSLFTPSLNLVMNRKPRYKIAIRQKPKKTSEHFNKKSTKETRVESTTRSIPMHENYMKVLMHLKNEKANHRHPNSLQPNYSPPNLNDDPRKRKPLQNMNNYYNYLPHGSRENTFVNQRPRQVRKNRPRQTHPEIVQRPPSRNRNLLPAFDLLPPSPFLIDDFARAKETIDYLTGNGSNQARNLVRPYRRASSMESIAGIRAKRRERRSANEGVGEDVKGSRPANNDATNRGEIEQAAKNSSVERNSQLKANSGLQVALVPDTSAEKRIGEKKSVQGRELQEGRVDEREIRTEGDLESFKYNDDEKSNAGSKSHEELLNEAPRLTNDVIQKEIDARFNGQKEEEDTQGDVEVEVPDFDYVEELVEENQPDIETESSVEGNVDLQKYPFYNSEKIPTPSALKYAIDPGRLPRKTYGGMEFYGSRDAYKHCEEVEPTLKVVPEKEEPVPERGPEENLPRLRGLGDKLDCFKAKYFDSDPFDNPLFLEKEVEDPSPPAELDTKRFASRIMMFPKQSDDYVVQKSSRKPENYRRPRKPSSNAIRSQKPRRVVYRTYPGTGRGKRPRVYRVQGVRVKYPNGSRRPQKVVKRPVTSASDVWSMYLPFQSQVYEDVMGTIRNMANSYQVYEVTTLPTSDEVTVDGVDDVKMNVSTDSSRYGKKDEAGDIKRPHKTDRNIEGMVPPKYRPQNGYQRIRIPQKNRTRVQHLRKSNGLRGNRPQKIRVYKRDLRDKENEGASFLEKKMFPDSEDNEEVDYLSRTVVKTHNSVVKNDTADDDLSRRNSTTSKTSDIKRKSKVPKNVSSSADEEQKKSQKIVYTIKDRIRYSKPKGEGRFGKFNETEVREDKRRREPTYNYIKRRKPLNRPSTTEVEITWTESSISTATLPNEYIEQIDKEPAKDLNKQLPVEEISDQSLNTSTKLEEQDQSSNKLSNNSKGYAVYENVNESEETTQKPHTETSSEFNLKSFLEKDSPGFTDTSEELRKVLSPNNSHHFKFESDSTNIGDKKLEEENASFEHNSNEASSEKLDTNVQTTTESSEESDSKESESEEHSSFFKYESRPSSPSENYEDEKISKGSSEEADESEEKEYVFPWYRDKENERRRRRNRGRIGEYEYPWERRERLAREERKKRKGLRSFDDEDVEDTSLHQRRIYPRGKYRFWSRKDASEENISDALGSSSEYRPIRKYSSKYNAKSTKLPIKKLKNLKSKRLDEIKRSIEKSLEGNSTESDSYKERGTSRGIVPEDVTLEPVARNRKKVRNSSDVEGRNSSESIKNSKDSEITVLKSVGESRNSTERSNKKRRRPAKNSISNAETVIRSGDDSNRTRRRQKSGLTTPSTITSASTASTTSASRVARRRNQKSVKDSKRTAGRTMNQSNNGVNNVTEVSKSSTNRSKAESGQNGGKNPTNEIPDQTKDETRQVSENSDKVKSFDKNNEEQKNNLENKKSDKDSKTVDEISKLNQKFSSDDDDKKFDFKDDRIELLSDFDKSEDISDEEFESALKIDAGTAPNRAVQLSEQESREVVSSVSWISENYNF
ncbi:uncharacterized protein LOC105661799 [Megachile rotundata]|uniref:uncharacterized protein LOC105661799 n=1 Tax=Megachile rotundata TaxID=143995 RepID=UPI003FD6B79D